MKPYITFMTLLVSIVLFSCSRPLKVTGTWETQIEEEDTGMTMTGTQSYIFTPTSKKNGAVVSSLKGKAIIDGLGEFNFKVSVPGAYIIQKDMIVIVNDTTAVESNIAFHPTSFIGLLSSAYMEEIKNEFNNDFAKPSPSDTLNNVVINDNIMTTTSPIETMIYKKIE